MKKYIIPVIEIINVRNESLLDGFSEDTGGGDDPGHFDFGGKEFFDDDEEYDPLSFGDDEN